MTLIEKIWFQRHWAWVIVWPLFKPLSKLFGVIAARRRNKYSKPGEAYRAPVPVIVVGNISVGGNGKTPVVVYLVEQLKALGLNPGVVSRGYGGKTKHYPLLVTESVEPAECGDEPKLIAQRTGVPVAVDPVRADAVQLLLKQGVDVVVTDDGLQHYALARDIECVVIDGERRFGNGALLPMGPLREPISRIDEVDFVICNGGTAERGEFAMSLKPSLAVNLVTGETRAVSELGECIAIAGIGHPPRFFKTLNQLDCQPIKSVGFSDHQAMDENELNALVADGQQLIMTEKDAVKCTNFARKNWWYLPVDAEFDDSSELQIREKLQKVMEEYGS